MPAIKIAEVGGIRPSVESSKLEDREAARAENVSLRFGDIRPHNADSVAVATIAVSNPLTIYRFQRVSGGAFNTDPSTGWVVKAGDVDYVRGQIFDDTTERTYYTGDGAPKATDLTGAVRQLGTPAPAAPVATRNVVDEYTIEERTGDIAHMIDTIEWCIKLGLPTTPQWFGATNVAALSLTQRTTGEGFNPEHPIQVVKGIAGDGSRITDTENYAFLLDPKLDGFWNSTYYCIPICAYGYAGEVSTAMETNLANILNPYTLASSFLTTAQKESLRDMVDEMFNLEDATLKGKSAELSTILKAFDVAVSQGLGVAKADAVADFYARSDVSSKLTASRNSFAEEVYALADRIMSYQYVSGG